MTDESGHEESIELKVALEALTCRAERQKRDPEGNTKNRLSKRVQGWIKDSNGPEDSREGKESQTL